MTSSADAARAAGAAATGAVLAGLLLAQLAGPAALAAQADAGEIDPAPLSLAHCITIALDHSRLVRDAELDLGVARKQVREAWSGVFPSIDATSTYTRNLTANEIFLPAIIFDPAAPVDEFIAINFSADNSWLASVHLDQPLFQAEIFIGVGAASRFRNLRTEQLRGRRQTVATNVRRAYYDLLLARESVRLLEESVRRVASTLEETRALQRTGLGSEYDVLRIEVELGNLRPNLRRAEDAVAAARRTLNLAMGLDVDRMTRVEGSLRALELGGPVGGDAGEAGSLALAGVGDEVIASRERLWELARARRSDLRQLDISERLAHAQLSAERASYYPRLFAFGDYQLSAEENGGPDFFGATSRDRTSAWRAGVRLELPIFEGFGRPARVAQRQLAVEQTRTQLVELEEQAHSELGTLRDRVEETRLRVRAQRDAVDSARRGFEIAAAEYRAGVGSQLQVTDAEVALRQSEFNVAQAGYDYLVARAELDRAAGIVPGVDDVAHARSTRTEEPQS